MQSNDEFNIEDLLKRGTLEMYFQPITSLRRGSVLGIEALVRAQDSAGHPIAPLRLFDQARQQNRLQQLDEHCQTLALRSFAPLHRAAPEMMLFVNVDAVSLALLDGKDVSFLHKQADLHGVDPRNVAVEILESHFHDTDRLKQAVAEYRRNGFTVVLDDIGAGESNLDRITQVQPDMIKADRSLIMGILDDYYKQEVFKSLVQLSERIGGWVIAEGIEQHEDAMTVLDLGGDLLQGYYLGRPERLPSAPGDGEAARQALGRTGQIIRQTGQDFKRFAVKKILRERAVRQERLQTARSFRDTLEARLAAMQPPTETREDVLHQILCDFPLVESACIVDAQGIQLTDSVLAPGKSERQRSVSYAPPAKGSDYSLKEYFYVPMELNLAEYETQPYVPLPNTDLCITITQRFHETATDANTAPVERILCLHILIARGVMERDPVPQLVDSDSPEVPRRRDGK